MLERAGHCYQKLSLPAVAAGLYSAALLALSTATLPADKLKEWQQTLQQKIITCSSDQDKSTIKDVEGDRCTIKCVDGDKCTIKGVDGDKCTIKNVDGVDFLINDPGIFSLFNGCVALNC